MCVFSLVEWVEALVGYSLTCMGSHEDSVPVRGLEILWSCKGQWNIPFA